MSPDVAEFAQVMIVLVCTAATSVGIGLGARVLWRMGSGTRPRALPVASDDRLQRLEQAVDAIAVEVERISEGQRFTVKLLADRQSPHAAELARRGGAGRANTPH
jgi:hypothetical protein